LFSFNLANNPKNRMLPMLLAFFIIPIGRRSGYSLYSFKSLSDTHLDHAFQFQSLLGNADATSKEPMPTAKTLSWGRCSIIGNPKFRFHSEIP